VSENGAEHNAAPAGQFDLHDVPVSHPVLASQKVFSGYVWDVVTDTVDLGEGGIVHRDYVKHTGAVVIMAMNEAHEVYLVRQYRHPVRRELWEPPAGLLDVPGEVAVEAAKRELHEEADLVADTWHTLADVYSTPGGNSERIRVFLARGLSAVPEGERFERTAEEVMMAGKFVPLAQLVEAILAGRVGGLSTTVGALTLDAAVRSGFSTLRPADAPFSQ
jgi:ADP-ribose pyrophosphatase